MTGEGPPLVELERVDKDFGPRRVLTALDLPIAAHRTTVLIGPSGCGKSTVLRLIIGLVRPDRGRVLVEGTPLDARGVLSWRQRTGYVIQGGGLFPHLDARGNVTLMARHLRWPQKRIADRLSTLLELAHFPGDALDRYPAELSGGQRQRVALMRALMLDPDLLLLDEPLGALDPMVRMEVEEDLHRAFRALGKTVVLVTHDLGQAGFLGDHLVLLREGRIVQQGTAGELVRAPAEPFVSAFVKAQRTTIEVP